MKDISCHSEKSFKLLSLISKREDGLQLLTDVNVLYRILIGNISDLSKSIYINISIII